MSDNLNDFKLSLTDEDIDLLVSSIKQINQMIYDGNLKDKNISFGCLLKEISEDKIKHSILSSISSIFYQINGGKLMSMCEFDNDTLSSHIDILLYYITDV